MSEPYPKSQQLARGERRYRRKVASPKQWQAIIAAKRGPCRCCTMQDDGSTMLRTTYHHIVPRDLGGDDVADNIVPLCLYCHDRITSSPGGICSLQLVPALTDAEYAYAVDKLGEQVWERVYGIEYQR